MMLLYVICYIYVILCSLLQYNRPACSFPFPLPQICSQLHPIMKYDELWIDLYMVPNKEIPFNWSWIKTHLFHAYCTFLLIRLCWCLSSEFHDRTLLGLRENIASELGTKPLLRNRHHLVSCREALRSSLTRLFLTNNICILFILGNFREYQ